jgi:transcription-repair coupling factor (superfamily II helicase)
MDRLVCGDVGFGKTEVALRAAAAAALAGRQVAVVAPTTVLARQHLRTFQRRFAGLGVEVAHLSRLVGPAEARAVKKGLADGNPSGWWWEPMRSRARGSPSGISASW